MTSSGSPLAVESRGDVQIWTLDRPDQRNTITDSEMVSAIESAARAVVESDARCVIVTGAGSAFSAGGNIHDIAEGTGYFGWEPFAQTRGYREGIQRIPAALYALDIPLIAAVNGPAIGAGFDLALVCDLRIASTRAVFAESFVKLGLIPGDGGAWLLPRIIGHARATELTLTGDRIDAATALEWGVVTRVVEPDDLMASALELAARITVNPPHAVRLAKRLIREAAELPFDRALSTSAAYQVIAHTTADHREAISAAIERRAPKFEGR